MLILAILVSKVITKFLRLTKSGGGTALPGLIALKIEPKLVEKLAKQFKKGSIIVTGTNGKTTTVKIIADALKQEGKSVLYNSSGSNLLRGIAATLAERSSLTGRLPYEYGLFEVDEASVPAAARQLDPKLILVLNLFRDQLDRYGELDKTAELIGNAIRNHPEAKVILNADDPLVASLARYTKNVIYFGIDNSNVAVKTPETFSDSGNCVFCGNVLNYDICYFGHMGKYVCPAGDFKRPTPHIEALDVTLKGLEGQNLEIKAQGQQLTLTAAIPGLYNSYNILGAFSAALVTETGLDAFKRALDQFETAFGRMEKVSYRGRYLYLLLIKNPMGFNQVINTFNIAEDKKTLMIAINDKFADGRDVSWLWDVEFEALRGSSRRIMISGSRAYDMALRLKYADITAEKVMTELDLPLALEKTIDKTEEKETIFIMPTYTAMFALRKYLSEKVKLKNFWETG